VGTALRESGNGAAVSRPRRRRPLIREQLWVEVEQLRCLGCGETWLHTEIGDQDEEPDAWLVLPCPECGAPLVDSEPEP